MGNKSTLISKKILILQFLKAALSLIPGGSSIKELIIGTYEKGKEQETDKLNQMLLTRIGADIRQIQNTTIQHTDIDYAINELVESQKGLFEELVIEIWDNLKNSTNIQKIDTIQEYILDRANEVAENTPWGTNIFTLPIIVKPGNVDIRGIDEILRFNQRCIIIGKPASGKSTAISRILLTAPRQNWFIPINLLKDQLKTPAEVKELTCDKLTITSGNFSEFQSEGRFVFIFDGLNECNNIPYIATSIYSLSTRFVSSKFVITCRTHEYRSEAEKILTGFQPYIIQDLTWSNQREYILNHTADNNTRDYLLKIFENDQELQEVCSNHFIFMMATLVIPEKRIAPRVSSEFYKLFLERFLRSMYWKRRTVELGDSEKTKYLEEIAFRMACVKDSKTSIKLQEIKQLFKDIGIANFNIVLNELLGNGLLEKIDGYIKFTQHTLQEFLLASWLVSNSIYPKKLQRSIDGSLYYESIYLSPKCEQFYRELT